MPHRAPRVSVCVITYNQHSYLAQCLESILAQQGDFTMDVVIADDCSTDGARELAESFARRDRRVRVLERERNLGMGGNARAALAACTGDLIALCEGDDFWTDPHKLQRQVERFRDPQVMLSVTGGIRVDEAGREVSRFSTFRHEGPLRAADILAAGGGRWPTCSTVFRRECLSRLPDSIYEQRAIDWPLHVLVAAQGIAWYDPTPTCAWRQSARGSWTETLRRKDAFVRHHRRTDELRSFFRDALGPEYEGAINRGLAPHVLYFYASRRAPLRAKLGELANDLPCLSWPERVAAVAFAAVPGLGELAFWVRRKLQPR
jgi:glycosyltransferase involved in cell wall biosynthesis